MTRTVSRSVQVPSTTGRPSPRRSRLAWYAAAELHVAAGNPHPKDSARDQRIDQRDRIEPSLTQATYDRLEAELEDLTTRGRVEIAEQIEAARALGDLSENGDYHAAKDCQGKMESRIRQLQALLEERRGGRRVRGPRRERRHRAPR